MAMAVKEESLHHATENLILPSPRKYYRANIDTSHWQLRSLISSPKQNLIYLPNGTDVYTINTKSRERELVASLSFLPRCLVASKDWLCCGGDNGNYTAISVKERSTDFNTLSFLDADADTRLPLDLDLTRRSTPGETSATLRRLRERAAAESSKVGTEIVNCITLWYPGEDSASCAYEVPVAVLSNNDCTVSMLNIATSQVLDTLTLPDLANRSALSPDGSVLVTVCDDPFLYVHERRQKPAMKKDRFDVKPTLSYEWVLTGKIQLASQQKSDKSQMRGSFALSFSRSGQFLAVATQYGIISVFDAECLIEDHSLITTFTTSRPGHKRGAVRDMEFCPGPFDLLTWTESSGRVGVADVRQLFRSRQTIPINSSDEKVERVYLSDSMEQRLPESRIRNRTELPASITPDYLGMDAERRQLSREMLDRHQTPLRAEELEVLQAHRVARRQRDAATAAQDALVEASSISRWGPESPWAAGGTSNRSSTLLNEGVTVRPESTVILPAALREFVNTDRTAASFRAFIDERNRESAERTADGSRQTQQTPRRRGAVILAGETPGVVERFRERQANRAAGLRGDNDTSSGLERLTLTSSQREPHVNVFRQATPPAHILAAFSRSREPSESLIDRTHGLATERSLDRATRVRVEVEDVIDESGNFANRLRQPWRPLDDAGTFGTRDETALLEGVLRATETMGCCWSPDGRILYVATLEGIHEYHVNVDARKKFPSLVLQ